MSPGGLRDPRTWGRAPRVLLQWLRADPWERDRIRQDVRRSLNRSPDGRAGAGRTVPAAGLGVLGASRVVASIVVLAVVASGAAVVVVAGRDDPQETQTRAVDGLAVATAASFAEAVTVLDPALRAQAIGRWVVESRVPEFVAAFDENYRDEQRRGGTLRAIPRAYKLTESSPDVAVVLIWKELVGTGGQPARSFEVSAYGVMRKGTVWQVFSYEGTVRDVPAGDARLDGFVPLYQQQGAAP